MIHITPKLLLLSFQTGTRTGILLADPLFQQVSWCRVPPPVTGSLL